jgi:hypothetical protein
LLAVDLVGFLLMAVRAVAVLAVFFLQLVNH